MNENRTTSSMQERYEELVAAAREIDASEAAYEGNEEDDERCRRALAGLRAALAALFPTPTEQQEKD